MSRQVARPSPDLVGTVLPGVAENDNDDLRSLLRWVADQPERPNVEIVCAHENSPVAGRKDAILVRLEGCASELSVASYLELSASGVAELRVLVLSCAMTERIEATIASANRLMSHCPGVPVITLEIRQQRRHGRGHAYDLRRLPVSRRRLLFLGHLDHSWVPDVQAAQRARVVTALCRLRAESSASEAMAALFASSALLGATSCSACGVCVRACPTGALHLDQSQSDAGTFTLTSALSRCTDCGRCVELCPSGVLTRTGQVDWARLIDEEPVTITTCSVRCCERCGANFAGSKTHQYCPPCQFRIENPFGSRQPCPSTSDAPVVTGRQPEKVASYG